MAIVLLQLHLQGLVLHSAALLPVGHHDISVLRIGSGEFGHTHLRLIA